MNEGLPVDPHQQQVFPAGMDAFEQELATARMGSVLLKGLVKRLEEVYKHQKQKNSQVDIKFTQDNPQILVKSNDEVVYQGNLQEKPQIDRLQSADIQQLGGALNYRAGQTVPNADRNISLKIDGEEVFALIDGIVQVNKFKEHSITIDIEARATNDSTEGKTPPSTQSLAQQSPEEMNFDERMRSYTPLVMATEFEQILGQSAEYKTDKFNLSQSEGITTLSANDGRGQLLTLERTDSQTLNMAVSESFNSQDWGNIIEMLESQQKHSKELEQTDVKQSSNVYEDYEREN